MTKNNTSVILAQARVIPDVRLDQNRTGPIRDKGAFAYDRPAYPFTPANLEAPL